MFSAKAKAELPQKSVLQIKQDDKFFCRLLTKESSNSNPSFRVSAAVTVPFVWESQPGTPKHTLFSEKYTLPPLTPPPSYYSNPIKNPLKKRSRSNLLLTLFPRLNLNKKTIMSPSPSSSSWSSSSDHSSSSSSSSSSSKVVVPMRKPGRRRRFLSYGSSFDFRGDIDEEEEEDDVEGDAASPTSTLCFGIPRSTTRTMAHSGFRGFCRRWWAWDLAWP